MNTNNDLNHGIQKGVVYVRLALGGDEARQALDAQLARIQQRANEDDVEIVRVFFDIQSGFHKLLNIEEILSDAKAGKFSVLYVDRLDRLSRKLSEALGFATELEKHGVAIRCVSQNLDTSHPEGKLMLSLLGQLSVFGGNMQEKG